MATRKRGKNAAEQRVKGIRARTLGDGRVVYDPLVKIDGKQRSLGACDTIDEAIAVRNAYFKHRAKTTGASVPRSAQGVLTVRQLGELCLSSEWDVDRWRKRVLGMAEFADWPANEVGPEHVRIWVAKMARTPLDYGPSAGELPTRSTVYSALSLLKRVYRWACMPEQGYVRSNPCEGVTIRTSTMAKLKTKRRVLDYLRESEVRKLLDAPPHVLPLEARTKFLVLVFSGARPGDVWRLTWDRIDWDAETIRFTSGKTSKEEQRDYTVHMLPQLKHALQVWHMHCGRRTEGLVFRNPDGKPFARGYDAGWADKRYRQPTCKQVNGVIVERTLADEVTVMKGYRSKVGITRNVPLYALRHTCASHLLLGSKLFTGGRRWDREEVQSHLGHLTPQATEFYMRSLGILGRRAVQESKQALKAKRARGDE